MTYPIPFSTQEEETMSSAESSSPPSPSPSPSLSPSPSPSASTGLHRMDDLRKVFARYDADGDGRISASELADVLRSFGSDASPAEVRGMIAEMDADGDGFVDLQEFADFHRRRRRDDGAEERELREAFDVYDLDRNGLISAEELHRVLRLLGEKCSVKDCSRMIRSFDDDGDGSVNFEEFKKMMTNGGVGGRKSSTSGRGGPSSSAA